MSQKSKIFVIYGDLEPSKLGFRQSNLEKHNVWQEDTGLNAALLSHLIILFSMTFYILRLPTIFKGNLDTILFRIILY